MNNNLFVFGCSYATGEELLLDRLGEIDGYRISTANDPRKFFKRLEKEKRLEEYESVKQLQKEIAWPQLLANKLKLKCVNLAESGNSLDKMLFQLYKEIYKGNITKDDKIIISLTKATRNAKFDGDVDSFQLPSLYWPVTSLLGVKDSGDFTTVFNKETDKALLEWFTNDRIVWDYIKNLQAIKNIGQFFNLHVVPTMKNDINPKIELLKKVYNDCSNGFLTDKGLDDFSQGRLAWGHPDKEAHIKFAEHLYELLR